MAQRRNPLVQALTTGFTLAFLRVSASLPLAFNRWLALRVGRLLSYVVPRVRRVTLENLDRAYGDSLSQGEKETICRGAIDNVSLVAAEFAHMARMDKSTLGSQVTLVGKEHLKPGQGYLIVGSHLGNWELVAPFMARTGMKVAEVVRPLDDPRVDRAIDAIRCTEEVTTIPKDNAGKEVMRLLKEGYAVGILIDQSPRESAVPVTFFDAPCWATIAPVMIAVRAKVPILPVSCVRNADYSYTLTFYPPLEMERTKNLRDDLVRNSQRCQDVIEGIVRKYPEQWLWLHRRWKERPRLAEDWAKKTARDK
ncbi:MAG: lysophospholipid acyltransferase family protein [Candidatus Hydrogenedentes bacterium]|nr:lysophospholipid acyltransferase family protein [Candidatus Hydrogenedentota bacterium]